MTCWKCGKDAGEKSECDNCEAGISEITKMPVFNIIMPRMIPIDANKIKTIDDIKLIIEAFQCCAAEGSPAAEKLKHLLKDT